MTSELEIDKFVDRYGSTLLDLYTSEPASKLEQLSNKLMGCKNLGGKVMIFGNGGSASIASHVCIDLIKAAGIPAACFSDPSMLTCFSNDFGYAHAYEKALEYHVKAEDLVILISSSGESQNIINAAQFCKANGVELITFSGFSGENRLRSFGALNFYVNSSLYNHVETTHSTWLLTAVDYCIEQQKRNR